VGGGGADGTGFAGLGMAASRDMGSGALGGVVVGGWGGVGGGEDIFYNSYFIYNAYGGWDVATCGPGSIVLSCHTDRGWDGARTWDGRVACGVLVQTRSVE